MPHRRQTIRDLVIGYVTGLPTTGSEVTVHRTYDHSVVPSIDVKTPDEENDPKTETGSLSVVFEVRSKHAEERDILDELDEIASEIEGAMEANQDLDGLGGASFLRSTNVELEGTADQPIGLMTITYSIIY